MRIEYVVLENFKSYRQDTTISFAPGTNAIIGPNGAGKSSILEAIGFALFNNRPEGFRQANLLSEGARSGRVLVGLVPSEDERLYEVERAYSERGTTRYRVLDPALDHAILAESNTDVNEWLRDALRIAPDVDLAYLFSQTVGVPQGTFTAPFLMAAADRKGTFDRLLRVDEYRRARDHLGDTERVLRERSDAWAQRIARMEGELAHLPRDREELESVEARLESLSARIAKAQVALGRQGEELQRLDESKSALDAATERLHGARAAQALEETRLAQAEGLLAEASEAQARVQEALPGYEAYAEAERDLASLEKERGQRDRLQVERQGLDVRLATLTTRVEQLAAELDALGAAQARIEVLAPLVARQRTLRSQLEAAQREADLLAEAEAQRARLEGERAQVLADLEAIGAEIAAAQACEAALSELASHLSVLSERERQDLESLAAARAERQRLAEQSETLSRTEAARCPVCEAELTAEHRDELILRNDREIAALDRQAGQLEATLKSARQDRSHAESRRGGLERELRHLRTDADQQRAAERLSRLDADLSRAAERERAMVDAPQRVASLSLELEALGDPQREDQLQRDKLARRGEIERDHRETLETMEALTASAATLADQLEAFGWLDQAIERAQSARAQHRHAYERYMQNLAVAGTFAARTTQVDAARARARAAAVALEEAARQQAQIAGGYDPARHAQVRSEHQHLSEVLAADRAQREAGQERQADLIHRIAELEALEQELAAAQQELCHVSDMRAVLSTIRDLLGQAGPHVTRQLVYQISRQASAIYADIMNDHSGRLNWSDDYELTLEIKGNQRSFQQLSGGEQMSAALALRLALLREVSAIDVAFFDEPTAHLDPQRREGLAERIMEVKGFSQIFVISHDDTFERAAQNYVRIVRDANGSHVEAS